MSDTKMTQKEMYAHIAEAMANDVDVVEFCQKKIEQLEKRASAPRKPRFNAEANEFALSVIEMLRAADAPMTNKEIVEKVRETEGDIEKPCSPQKVAAALRKIENGQVLTEADGDVVEVTLVVDEGEKKSDPKTFAIN